jgi:hypothetical protein
MADFPIELLMSQYQGLLIHYCDTLGIDYPQLPSKQRVAFMKYLMARDKVTLSEDITEIAKNGECLAPVFQLFLLDVINGKIKRPNGSRRKDMELDPKIINDLTEILSQGKPISGNCLFDGDPYEYGAIGFVAQKYGVSETYVKKLAHCYIEVLLKTHRGNKESVKKYHPELSGFKLLK